MKHLLFFPLVVVASSVILPLFAGEDIATSEAVSFRFNTVSPVVIDSAATKDAFYDWPLTYRKGETVMVTSPSGETTTLVSSAAADGTQAYVPTSGGLWTFANSNGDTAVVGVSWVVYGEEWSLDTTSPLMMHTEGEGPDRKLKKREAPPVAYSGDDWKGDLTKASTITFTPPEGSGLEPTTWNKTGRGASAFTFNKKGVWTVTLTFADNTTRTAQINIEQTGITIIVK